MADDAGDGFLSRWSRRKAAARVASAQSPPEPEPPTPPADAPAPQRLDATPPAVAAPAALDAAPAAAPPPPTLEEAAALPSGADVTRFVARGVDPTVKNAALKRLFADPHFNIMDGLDTYIDDYGRPDPLPAAMLRQMVQAGALGLFDEVNAQPAQGSSAPRSESAPAAAPPPADDGVVVGPAPPPPTPAHPGLVDEDPALRLQPHAAAGRAGGRPPAPGDRPDRAGD